MRIEIDLNINMPQLAQLLASASAGAIVTASPKPAKPTADKAPPKAETKPEPEAPAEEPEDDLIGGDGPTIEDVKEAAKAYSVKNGRDALAQLIQDHGGSKGVTTIPEGNYQAFIDGANG